MRRRRFLPWLGRRAFGRTVGLPLLLLSIHHGLADEAPPPAVDTPKAADFRVQVVTADGLPLPGATVRVASETGESRVLLADRQGEVLFSGVRCDVHADLFVEFPGMVARRIEACRPCATSPGPLRVCLDEATVEHVRLVCPPPLIDLGQARSSTVFTAEFRSGLPGAGGLSRPRAPGRNETITRRCEDVVLSVSSGCGAPSEAARPPVVRREQGDPDAEVEALLSPGVALVIDRLREE